MTGGKKNSPGGEKVAMPPLAVFTVGSDFIAIF